MIKRYTMMTLLSAAMTVGGMAAGGYAQMPAGDAQPGGRPHPAPNRVELTSFPSLAVSASAEVSVKPDMAVVSFGAEFQGNTAAEAQQQVNAAMNKVVSAVRDLDVPAERISTANISLYPVYSNSGFSPRGNSENSEPRLVGFRASNTIRVEVSDLSQIGPVIDAATKAGANRLEGVSFELRDDTAARTEALTRAAEIARAKAQALAGAMGVSLDSIAQVEEAGATIAPPMPMMGRALKAEMANMSTPVSPGQIRVSAGVTVVYRISRNNADNAADNAAE